MKLLIHSHSIEIEAPENIELRHKLTELKELEEELVEHELVLANMRFSLKSLEIEYLRRVGCHFEALDQLTADVAELVACYTAPSHGEEKHRQRLHKSNAAEPNHNSTEQPTRQAHASQKSKRLFRQIAIAIHPDLASDDKDRALRTEMMIRLNQAYEDADDAMLEQIWSDWRNDPDKITESGVGADLVRTIRRISQITKRIKTIELEKESLQASELSVLAGEIEIARVAGKDMLDELAATAKLQLDNLLKQLATAI